MNFFSKKNLVAYYFLFCFLLSTFLYFLYTNNFFEKSELASIEYRFNNIDVNRPINDILIVNIDDTSINKYGAPLPRDILGFLVEKSIENNAKLIIFDVMFYSYNEQDIRDLYLATQIKKSGKVIIASYMSKENGGTFFSSDETFRSAALGEGLINISSNEGTVFGTKLHRYEASEQLSYPIISVEAFLKVNNIKNPDAYLANNYDLYKSELLINYAGGRGTFPSISISDILSDNFDFAQLNNKYIFVGATYAASQDFYITPFHKTKNKGIEYKKSSDISTPGVEVHANILNTLINKNNLIRRDYPFIFFIALCMIISVSFLPLFRFVYLFIPLCLYTFTIIFGTYIAFKNNYIIDIIPLFVVIAFTYVSSISFKILFETLEKKRIQKMFGKYLAPEVVKQLVKQKGELTVGGETRTISIFFSDIADFTNISERLPPDKLVLLLNGYFNKMVDIITKNGGIIDKYIGDAIMALYGSPIASDMHADNVVKSALEMRSAIDSLKPQWEAATGLEFNARIGINSGAVVVGNIGSDKTLQYTAIGDNVNLASRLEGVNKYYGTNIIISEYTYNLLKNKEQYILRELDFIKVKGKDTPVKIFEAAAFNTPENTILKEVCINFEKGLALYRALHFKDAKDIFDRFPNDYPSFLFSERCVFFIETPPPKNWDKVFTLKTK